MIKTNNGAASATNAITPVPECRFSYRIFIAGLALVLVAMLSAGCNQTPPLQQFKGYAQGTSYHISYWSATSYDAAAVKKAVTDDFAVIDKLLSNYRPDSVIEKFNRLATTKAVDVGTEITHLISVANSVHSASNGCYDLTIKPLFSLWGFDSETPGIPSAENVADTLKKIGMSFLTVVDDRRLSKQKPDLQVDLSSIAQGYSVESISRVLEQHGIKDYLVEIGGELKTRGSKPDHSPWHIAVEKPLPDQHALHKILAMPANSSLAIMTSGTYRHYFDANGRRYSHILDARTGQPVTHDLVSVTVAHSDPIVADAWSTALLCLGRDEGLKTAEAENLAVLFVQLQKGQLVETQSTALAATKLLNHF